MTRAAVLVLVLVALAACRDDARPAPAPSVRITVTWPGASPGEIDRQLVPVLEAAVAGVPGVLGIRSTATLGEATVEVTGAVDGDALVATIAAVGRELPASADVPTYQRLDPDPAPVLAVVVDDRLTAVERGERLDALAEVPGLRVVERCGGASLQLTVIADPARVNAFGLSLLAVADAIETASRTAITADQLGDVAVGPQLRLRDVAAIRDEVVPGCRATLDGRAVGLALVSGGPVPATMRVLDGPVVHGELDVRDADQAEALERACARVGQRWGWVATRFDPDRQRVSVAVGLTRGLRGTAVAAAIDDIALELQLPIGRWTGPDLRVATAIVSGPDAREAGPRLAAELAAGPGVAAAGCEPCSTHAVRTLHLHDTRLAAIGARASDVYRLAAIARGGLDLGGAPPIRLLVADGTELDALRLPTEGAGLVALADFVTFDAREVATAYLRVDRAPAVELWVRGTPGTSAASVRALLATETRAR